MTLVEQMRINLYFLMAVEYNKLPLVKLYLKKGACIRAGSSSAFKCANKEMLEFLKNYEKKQKRKEKVEKILASRNRLL